MAMNNNTAAELTSLSLTEAASLICAREVSPVELTEACLNRIEAWDPIINAFITVAQEQALDTAAACERAITDGNSLGPLHGVPIGIKDNIDTAGLRTTAGSRILADNVPERDATVVARLRDAGAVVVGKLNMHEFAWGGTTANPHYGPTKNPWDPTRFPAGSSGGSGAAVAACEVFGALGTDTGGSVRLPAAVNGCVGIRPTIGRVSNANVVPLAWSMDTVGPMARTVEDVARMLGVIAGFDPDDEGTDPRPVPDYLRSIEDGVRGLHIGVVSDYFFSHLQKPVEKAVRLALELLTREGAVIDEIPIANIQGNISAQLTVESAEPSTFHQRWLRERPEDYGEDVRLLLELGEMYTATQYINAQRYRSLLRSEFLDAFHQVDVFICPTLPFVATPLGETKVVIEDGVEDEMLSAIMQFTGVPSLTGLPSMSVPCGFSDEGLPIGMQIIGRPFDEATIFRVGHAYQRCTDWHKQKPSLPVETARPAV